MAEPSASPSPASDSGRIFESIVAGRIPCHKVYEDDHVLAFLDIQPISRGHTLVIPKRRADRLDAMEADDVAAIGRVLPKIARAVLEATGARDFNILQNNGPTAHQAVAYVHFHIIPVTGEGGLGINWPAGRLDDDEAVVLREAIAGAVGGVGGDEVT